MLHFRHLAAESLLAILADKWRHRESSSLGPPESSKGKDAYGGERAFRSHGEQHRPVGDHDAFDSIIGCGHGVRALSQFRDRRTSRKPFWTGRPSRRTRSMRSNPCAAGCPTAASNGALELTGIRFPGFRLLTVVPHRFRNVGSRAGNRSLNTVLPRFRLELQRSAHRQGQLARDRQPEPATRCARPVAPVEPLEDLVGVLARNAGAIVLHLQQAVPDAHLARAFPRACARARSRPAHGRSAGRAARHP